MGDVDQEILLKEALDLRLGGDSGDNLEGGRSDVNMCDEDTSVEHVLGEVLGKVAHLLDTDVGIGKELDPDRTNIRGGRVWIVRGGGDGVFFNHRIAGSSRELHMSAPGSLSVGELGNVAV